MASACTVLLQVRSALILEDPDPSDLSIYAERSRSPGGSTSDSFENGQVFLQFTNKAPAIESPNDPSPPPATISSPGYIDAKSGSKTRSTDEGAGGLFGIGTFATGAIVTSCVLLLLLGLVFLVMSGRLCGDVTNNSGDRRTSDDDAFFQPDATNKPDVISIQVRERQDVQRQK